MTHPAQSRSIEEDEERQNRERKLDDTLEDSFPASDPLSTDPNPDDHGANDHEPAVDDRDRNSPAPRNPAG